MEKTNKEVTQGINDLKSNMATVLKHLNLATNVVTHSIENKQS